jgi:hypothetical protein
MRAAWPGVNVPNPPAGWLMERNVRRPHGAYSSAAGDTSVVHLFPEVRQPWECGCAGAIPVTHQEAGSKVQPRTVDVGGSEKLPLISR